MNQSNYSIIEMSKENLDQVMLNEKATYTFPWRRVNFEDCLNAGYPAYLLKTESGIVGHAVISIAAEECHILNISIIPSIQRQGWGTLFLENLITIAKEKNAKVIILEVRPTNKVGIALYKSAGFAEIGTRKHYYPAKNGREDALVLKKDLIPEPTYNNMARPQLYSK